MHLRPASDHRVPRRQVGPTGWCGQSDGADQAGPYPFCGGARHESRCPKYRLRLDDRRPDLDEARALAVLRYWFGDVEVLELINQQPPQPKQPSCS
jgi:hypothetical protein